MPPDTPAEASLAPIRRLSPGSSRETSPDLPHVLLILDGFPQVLGGGERIVLRMAELLPRYGYRVSILTFSVAAEGEFDPSAAPCPLYLLPLTSTHDMQALRGAFALRRLLRQQKVQIVQTFFESSDLWAGTLVRLFSRARLIWSRRDMGILRGKKHIAAYRALRSLPHAVFAVSEQVRRHVITTDRIAPDRVHTIYNGLELGPTTSEAPKTLSRPMHITCVGNLRSVKGHDLLVEAAAVVLRAYPDTQFTIAGEILDRAYVQQLLQRMEELGLTSRFRLLGKITDLASHLHTADLFVLPSRSEGFSNALIEAMAAGLPCVATRVGGNAEAINDGENGLLVPPQDTQALAAALCFLLHDPQQARALGVAARDTVVERFTAEAMMQKTTQNYAFLLAPR